MIRAEEKYGVCPNCMSLRVFHSVPCKCLGKRKALVYKGKYVDYSKIQYKLEFGEPTLFTFHTTIDDLIRDQEIKQSFTEDFIARTAIENLKKCKLITVYESKMGE